MVIGELSEAKIHVLPSPEMLVIQTGFIFKQKIFLLASIGNYLVQRHCQYLLYSCHISAFMRALVLEIFGQINSQFSLISKKK